MSLLTPARVFFAFVFLMQFVGALYDVRELEMPPLFDIFTRIALVWLVWLWLLDDGRRLGITWVMDLGMFLWIAWPLVLPYHLFKTRGLKGVIPILVYILVILSGSMAAVLVSALI